MTEAKPGAPHLLRVKEDAKVFAPLIRAVRASGLRVGWLELDFAEVIPPGLEQAAGLGVLRAVAVGGGRSVAVKPMTGEAVLRDVLREHFRGCALVLVRGEAPAPLLVADGEGWKLLQPEGEPVSWRTDQVVAALRRPAGLVKVAATACRRSG